MLFVHGAFGSPWMWHRHLMPHLAERGIDSVAIRLPGAGEAHLHLPGPGLSDYVGALEDTARIMGRTVLVVGHSLGALVAQLALGSVAMAGVMLMAPVPPTGMAFSSLRLAACAPSLWTSTALTVIDPNLASSATTRATLFTDSTPEEVVLEAHRNMLSQPARPVLEAQWPHFVARAGVSGVPVRVLAAAEDRLVPVDVVEGVAAHHGCDAQVVAGCGHALMLDEQWREGAASLVSFIDELED